MAKYDPLREYLRGYAANEIALSFDQVEDVISGNLPPSAHKYRAWWANDETHVHARAWLDAGWKVESVNSSAKRVVFVRRGGPSPPVPGERPRREQPSTSRARHVGYWDSARPVVPSIEDLTLAHNVFLEQEPRNLFYVREELMSRSKNVILSNNAHGNLG